MTRARETGAATDLDGRDLLVRNSVLLMATQVAVAGLGFIFWIAAARLLSAESVGLASTLLAAINLLSFLSLGGLNETIVRFLGVGELRRRQVSQGVLATAVLGFVLGIGYAVIAPVLVPRLAGTLGTTILVLGFALASGLAAVNLFTDSVFVGIRAPGYNIAIDGVLQGLTKLGCLLVIALAFAPTAIVASTWAMVVPMLAGYGAAALASLVVLRRRFDLRFTRSRESAFTRSQWFYSGGSYAASVLDIAPLLIVPLIVLRHHGEAYSAYYFTAVQIATLVHGFLYAIGQSSLSEASSHPGRFRAVGRRAAILCAAIAVPGAIGLALVGPYLLRLFGGAYADGGRELLIALAVTTIPVAVTSWTGFHLRVKGQVRALVASTVAFLITIVALCLAWADRDLVWIGWAWCAGWTVRGAVGLAAVWWRRHDPGLISDELRSNP